jgi:hypothetical protein
VGNQIEITATVGLGTVKVMIEGFRQGNQGTSPERFAGLKEQF